MDIVARIWGISSVEGSEGSSGRERYVVATASGPGLRADASSHQLAGRLPLLHSHRVLSLLGPSNLKTGKQKLGPETAAPRRKEGAARGVGVVVRCVDELLSQCLVIVDRKGPFLWCGGRPVDTFRKPVCSAIRTDRGVWVAGAGGGAK